MNYKKKYLKYKLKYLNLKKQLKGGMKNDISEEAKNAQKVLDLKDKIPKIPEDAKYKKKVSDLKEISDGFMSKDENAPLSLQRGELLDYKKAEEIKAIYDLPENIKYVTLDELDNLNDETPANNRSRSNSPANDRSRSNSPANDRSRSKSPANNPSRSKSVPSKRSRSKSRASKRTRNKSRHR